MFIKRKSVQEHHQLHFTDHGGSGGKASDLHSDGTRFERRLRQGIFLSVPLSKCPNGTQVDDVQYVLLMLRFLCRFT